MSDMKQQKAARCPIGIFTLGGRWKFLIVYHLFGGTRRFGELQRLIPEASRQMLTLQLRDLEKLGLIHREVYALQPPKVEYSLTERGRSLEPALHQLLTTFETIVGVSAEEWAAQPTKAK